MWSSHLLLRLFSEANQMEWKERGIWKIYRMENGCNKESRRAGSKTVRLQKKKRNRQSWNVRFSSDLGSQMAQFFFSVKSEKCRAMKTREIEEGNPDCIICRAKIGKRRKINCGLIHSFVRLGKRADVIAEELNCDDDGFINQEHSQHDTISYTSLNRFLFNWFPFVSIVPSESFTHSSSVKTSFLPIFSLFLFFVPLCSLPSQQLESANT